MLYHMIMAYVKLMIMVWVAGVGGLGGWAGCSLLPSPSSLPLPPSSLLASLCLLYPSSVLLLLAGWLGLAGQPAFRKVAAQRDPTPRNHI